MHVCVHACVLIAMLCRRFSCFYYQLHQRQAIFVHVCFKYVFMTILFCGCLLPAVSHTKDKPLDSCVHEMRVQFVDLCLFLSATPETNNDVHSEVAQSQNAFDYIAFCI